jgi:hypothetical protein
VRLLPLVSISTMLFFAAPASQAPPPDAPVELQPLTAPDVTPGASTTSQLTRKLADLEAKARRQERIIRKLRNSLRASVDTAGGLARAFLCIHRFEGSWTDSGTPYWGGLQFDAGFMSTYGRAFLSAWGTADHWPPFIQIAVAENAYLSGRGFSAWPTSARFCGLL